MWKEAYRFRTYPDNQARYWDRKDELCHECNECVNFEHINTSRDATHTNCGQNLNHRVENIYILPHYWSFFRWDVGMVPTCWHLSLVLALMSFSTTHLNTSNIIVTRTSNLKPEPQATHGPTHTTQSNPLGKHDWICLILINSNTISSYFVGNQCSYFYRSSVKCTVRHLGICGYHHMHTVPVD
jgi:hypothetical protein